MKHAIWILWPSFLVAAAAEALFFTLFDPSSFEILGRPSSLSSAGAYSAGFFFFWLLAAASSAFTCFLQRTSAEINGLCPFRAADRPAGCPKGS